MDQQIQGNVTQAAPAAQLTSGAEQPAPKQRKRWTPQQAPTYRLRTTVLRRKVTLGNVYLSRFIERNWTGVHQGLFYVTAFAPQAIGGRVVMSAAMGLREYVAERIETAQDMLKAAQSKVEGAGLEVGESDETKEHTVEISSRIEREVLNMVRTYDDYLVVADTLWIEGEITEEAKNEAHRHVKASFDAMSRLLRQIRSKLITYRRERGEGTLTKSEAEVVIEMENIVLGQLSTEGQERMTRARKRQDQEDARTAAATAPKPLAPGGAPAPTPDAAVVSTSAEAGATEQTAAEVAVAA